MGMNAICPSCGHGERSDNHRGSRLGTCPQCGTPMRAHTAGRAKGRYICPVNGGVSTHGLGHTVQLTEPMRLEFVPGWDDDRREPDPDRPGWLRPVTYHRTEPTSREQEQLDRAAGRVFGPGCVLSGGFAQPEPGDRYHGKAGVFLLPARDADPAAWFVNEPVRYKKCAACPKRVVASDKTRIDHEWVPARENYWRGHRSVNVSRGPHPAGTYACPNCRPPASRGADQPEEAAANAAGAARQDAPTGHEPAATPEQANGARAAVDDEHGPADCTAIHDAVARLAGVCDFAESQDGQGFNATDTWLGHALAAMPATEWTTDQALTAWDMLRKYSGQLDGFGIPHGSLPRPPGAGELEEARRAEARERARQGARRWRDQQYRKARSYVRCDGAGEQVILAFPYDPELVSQAKAIKGRSFDWDTKDNVYPFTSLPQVAALAEAHGIDIAAETRALVPIAAAMVEQEAARPNVYTDPAGRVVIRAEYDPRLNEALKQLNGGRSTWDRTARVHVAPVHRDPARVLAITGEFGLTVGEDARAAITGEQGRQDRNEAAGTAFEAAPVPIPGLADGLALKPQQYPVVRFATEHRRVLIGDGMGWGKTLSSLAAVAADGAYPAAVVCRPSLTLHWVAEIRRFFPDLAVHEASGTTSQPIPTGTDVIVIGSAALAARPQKTRMGGKEFGWVKTLAAAGPKALIIDEGQDTKERAANRSQACEQLAASVIGRDGLVLDLTGTAILNRPRELCQQLSILGRIGEFGGPKAFLWRYCLSEVNEWGASYDGARNLIELHDRLLRWGIMIRRADDAKLGLPPCREHVLRIPEADLDPAVMARYRRAEAELLAFLADQARQAAEQLGQDPTSAAVQATVRARSAEHLVAINTLRQLAGQAKRGYVTAWIGEHVAAGEKVMVAAHHRDEVDAYAAAFGGLKLRGGQSVAGKEAAKAAFQNQPAAQAPVIAVAIGAGGVGHTLTAAATGIQAEQAWTPGETQQMKKRLHRIGQDRPVDYYITVAANTIDEHLWDVVTTKQATLDAVLDGKTDEGTDDGEASVAAELTWRLTQQGLGGHPGRTATPSHPGAPPSSAPAARRAPSGPSRAAAGDTGTTRLAGPVAVDEPVTSLLLVTGPREGVARETVRAALEPRFAGNIMLVTGGAAGVDTHAAQLWREWGGLAEEHRVSAEEWGRDPRGAGYARNACMVQRVATAGGAVLVIDLPCTKPGCTRARPHNTHGTSHCAALAKQAGLPVDHYQAPVEPVTGNGAAHGRPAVSAGRPAATAAQDGGEDGGGPTPPARVTRYTRDGGGQTLTVYAPRPGELDVAAFAAFTAGQAVLGLDVETSALRDDGPRQFGTDFTVRLIQFGSEDAAWVLNLADPAQRDAAVRVLADPARRFVTHTPYDVLAVWSVFGISLGQRVIDTHLLSKLVNPDERAGHGLKQLSSRHLDDGLAKAEEALHRRMWAAAPASQRNGGALARWGWNHLPADDEDYVVYAGLDTIYARRLLPVLTGRCAPFAHLIRAESWLAAQASGITIRGLQLDQPYTRALLATLEAEHAAAEAVITARLGCRGASPRFAAWLDEQTRQAGISGLARTETGQLQVTDATLTALLGEHHAVLPAHVEEMARQRLVMSKTANLIANLRGFLAAADPAGRVHPQVNTLRAKTARMSITAPALQTLKKHDPRLRRCFRADPGHVLISCDFSQVEIRVAAALSGDPALLETIGSGTDIHDATARLIYGPGFTPEQRTIAKRATFGAIYGGGARALAAQTGASEDAAREVISRWKNAYPGVAAYGRRMAELPEITTASGRRIPADPGRPYASANYAIQSTARDLLVAAIYTLVTEQKVGGLWLFVHDEIIVQAPERDAERVRGLLQQAMTGTFRGVPVLAEATILGPTWGRLDTPAHPSPQRQPRTGQGPSPAHEHNGEPEPQAALFDIAPLRDSTLVTGLTAGTFDPAASDRALIGDGYHWLDALLPAPQSPTCETCGHAMRLPVAAPILWACPACHGGEAGSAGPSPQTPSGPPPPGTANGTRNTDDNDDMDGQPRRAPEDSRTAQLRAFAHRYLDHGLLPVPAWAARHNGECCCRRGADCPRPGKHPRSVHTGPGPSDYSWKPLACHTHEEIDERFADGGEYAGANLMLAIPAGMMVIDQDNDDGGRQAVTELAAGLGELPPTLSHQTPHGRHLIYRTPPGWSGRAWVGKDARNPLPAGIDLRMPGQILMAPPSQVPGPDGLLAYGPAASGETLASLPAAYLSAWTPPKTATQPPGGCPVPVAPEAADRAASYVHKTITGIVADLASHEPGGRNTAIYTAALKVGSVLGAARVTPGAENAADGWTDEMAQHALLDAAAQNGYVDAHGTAMARSAIRSGLRNGLRRPRALPRFTPQSPPPVRRNAGSTSTPSANGAAAAAGKTTGTGQDPESSQEPPARPSTDADAVEVRQVDGVIRVSHRGRVIGRIYRGQGPRGTFYRAETASRPQATPAGREIVRHLPSLDAAASAIIAASNAAARPAGNGASAGDQHSNRTQANRAALAANEAYRAGNLDQAQQHIDRAAVLDPSRARLWQQHRTEIAAKRLFLAARQAQAEGNPDQARQLLSDAQELDPRMEAIWNRHLPQTRALRREPTTRDRAAPEPATRRGGEAAVSTRARDTDRGNSPNSRWPGDPSHHPQAGTSPTRPGTAASPGGHTGPEEQAPGNARNAGRRPEGTATPEWWHRANLGEAQQQPAEPQQDLATRPAVPTADRKPGPLSPDPASSRPGQDARADPADQAGRLVRADPVKPGTMVHHPHGERRGRGVVARKAGQMPGGTVLFDTDAGRTGHFRPGHEAGHDLEATGTLAAEPETQQQGQPHHTQPSQPASPAPSERRPNRKPSPREHEHEDPAAVETAPDPGKDAQRASPVTRAHQSASRQADAVDWRDTLSSSERNAWQPRTIQPGNLPMPAAEAKGLEIGN